MQVDVLQQKQTEGVYSFSQGDDKLMSPVSPIHQDASFAARPAAIFRLTHSHVCQLEISCLEKCLSFSRRIPCLMQADALQ